MMENFLTIDTNSGPMSAFICSENTSKKRPVVIVLQEAFGVNHYIKEICKRFAREGYLAIAPEFYHRQGEHITVGYGDRVGTKAHMSDLTNEGIVEDLQATVEFLRELPSVDLEKIFCVGFCVGGFMSVLASMNLKLCGAVSFYGAGQVHPREGLKLTPLVCHFEKIRCPIFFLFGGDDASIPRSDRETIEKMLKQTHRRYQWRVFDNSDHGFFCDERSSYNPESSRIAWKEILSFISDLQTPAGLSLGNETSVESLREEKLP